MSFHSSPFLSPEAALCIQTVLSPVSVGRRQAARHTTLTRTPVGSNPTGPVGGYRSYRCVSGGENIGKARSYEIIEYRKKIMDELCTNSEILKLLDAADTGDPGAVIPFNKAYPYEYVPEEDAEPGRLICFDIQSGIDSKNKTLKELTVMFFAGCHQDAAQYTKDGSTLLWYDRAVCALEEVFGGQSKLGVGKAEFVSNVPYSPQKKIKGRKLTLKIFDFNDGRKYGR